MRTERRSPIKHHTGKGSPISDFLKSSLMSVAASLIGMLAVAFLASAIIIGTKDPLSALLPASIILIAATSLSSGFIACKLYKKAPISIGLLSGALITALILIVALFSGGSSSALTTGVRVILHLIPLPVSALGAFLGTLKPRRRRRTTIRR